MTHTLSIDLLFPPSVNRIWRSRTGANGKPQFYLDKRYATWKRDCDNLGKAHGWHKKPIKGNFVATITLNAEKRSKNKDVDNRIKAVLDWLQRATIIENDSLADEVTVRWGYAPEGVRISLAEVRPYSDKETAE